MTIEEAKVEIEEEFNIFLERTSLDDAEILNEKMKENAILRKIVEANRIAIKALEQESESLQFANWVATEIFNENWKDNNDSFVELACRKLEKLGIVRAKSVEWELIAK